MDDTSKPQKVTNNALLATLAGVILATVLGILGYYITRPYVQYEEGQFYKTGNFAVTSLRLENNGYFDAEDVVVQAAFTETITDVTSGSGVSPIAINSGGKGLKTVVLRIERIVPSQAAYIYFAVDNSGGGVIETDQGFTKEVTFKNGKGTTQPPGWKTFAIGCIISAISIILSLFVVNYWQKSKELKEIKTAIADGLKRMEERQKEYDKLIEEERKQLSAELERMARESEKRITQIKSSETPLKVE